MNAIEKVSYTHEAMIDLLIARPMISQREIAHHFGYTEGWVSRIIRSDAFREQVAARREELVDPLVLQTIDERLSALVHLSTEVLMENIEAKRSTDAALKALEVSSRALGYGVAKGAQVNVQANFVVAMPEKSANSGEWLTEHRPQRPKAAEPGKSLPQRPSAAEPLAYAQPPSALEREIDAI